MARTSLKTTFAAGITATVFLLGGFLLAGASAMASDFDQRRLEVSTKIDAYVGGLHVAEVDLTTRLDQGDYLMESKARTLGLADLVVKGHFLTTARGTLQGNTIRPAHFLSTYGGRWGDRRAEMEFDDKGPTTVTAIPAYSQDQRKQVPMDQRVGTIDPLSAALFSVTFASSGKICDGAVNIFDGRRRYDLALEYLGEEELNGRKDMAYSGKAFKCRVHQDRITGFWEGEVAQTGAMRRSAAPRVKRGDTPATVWVGQFEAPDGGAPILLPVKVHVESEYGHMLAHMTRVDMKSLAPIQPGQAEPPANDQETQADAGQDQPAMAENPAQAEQRPMGSEAKSTVEPLPEPRAKPQDQAALDRRQCPVNLAMLDLQQVTAA